MTACTNRAIFSQALTCLLKRDRAGYSGEGRLGWRWPGVGGLFRGLLTIVQLGNNEGRKREHVFERDF